MIFGWLDIGVLGAYFVAILAVGFWFGRRERSTIDYFLGGRRQHWLVVGLSIIATEVSALTFLVVPGRSFETDFWYLQAYVGAFIGRLLIVFFLLLIGSFFKEGSDVALEGGWKTFFMTLIFIGIILIFMNALGWLSPLWDYLSEHWETRWVGSLILLVVIILFMWYITKSQEAPAAKKEE